MQAVPGLGPEIPQLLCSHPLIKKISLTGSTAAGAKAAASAASHVIPSTLELGGKNAFLIFNDTDLDRAVSDSLEGAFFNKGEACTASSRLLVQSGVYDEFVDRLGKLVEKLVVGSGSEKGTHIGPCVSEAQKKKVLEYIEVGKAEGATVFAQAKLPSDPAYRNGYFVPPTMFTEVKKGMRVGKEEIFGPVVVVIKFETEEEAIELANDSDYGLTCGVYTKDSEKGLRIARKVDVGMVWINHYFRSTVGLPFGGQKAR